METTTKAALGAVALALFLPAVLVLQNPILGAVAAATVIWAGFTHQRGGSLSGPPVLLAGAVVCAGLLSDGYLLYALVGANIVLWAGSHYGSD